MCLFSFVTQSERTQRSTHTTHTEIITSIRDKTTTLVCTLCQRIRYNSECKHAHAQRAVVFVTFFFLLFAQIRFACCFSFSFFSFFDFHFKYHEYSFYLTLNFLRIKCILFERFLFIFRIFAPVCTLSMFVCMCD